MDLFKRCPQCGRRFHIILLEKKLDQVVNRETVQAPVETLRQYDRLVSHKEEARPAIHHYSGGILLVGGEPITIDAVEFQYRFKCKHCGHEWSEEHIEKHVEESGTDD